MDLQRVGRKVTKLLAALLLIAVTLYALGVGVYGAMWGGGPGWLALSLIVGLSAGALGAFFVVLVGYAIFTGGPGADSLRANKRP